MGSDIPARYIFIALVFCGMFMLTLLRTNLSISIILMVKPTSSESNQTLDNSTDICPGKVVHADKNNSTGTLEWTSVQQGTALGCFTYGNIVTSILGPWLAKKFGAKLVVGISMVLTAVFTLLCPLAANHGFGAFIAVRTLVGFFLGPFFPTCAGTIPTWFAPDQHTSAFSIIVTGYCLGCFSSLNICSLLAEYAGWEAVFYVSGSLALGWCLMWFLLMYNSPSEHPRLSKNEEEYLKKNIPKSSQKNSTNARVPWIGILTSLPYLAVNVSRVALEWTFSASAVLLPVYLATVLKMDIAMVGISSGLPFLIGVVVVLLGSKIVDILRQKNTLTLTTIRKILVLTTLLGSAVSVLLGCYAGCNQVLAVVFFIMLVQFFLLHAPGTEANVLDLSPTYCGIMLGLSLCVTSPFGFIAPLVAGYILDQNNTLSGWRTFFLITASINIFAAVFYLIFGSAVEQSWSKDAAHVENDEAEAELKSDLDVEMK